MKIACSLKVGRLVAWASCLGLFIALAKPAHVQGHEGHDHGAVPGVEAAALGPVTLSEEVVKNLGVQTADADIVPLQRTLELVGRIQGLPERQAKVSPRVEGRVTEILVKLGDRVTAGQPLVRFQPLTVGSPAVTISSPIGGYISRQETNLGQTLRPETVLMEVADYGQVLAKASMFESAELSLIQPGQSARVRLDSFPDEVFEGKVQRLDVGLEADSRTFEAYVLLENPELKLRPNMLATVLVALGEPQEVLAVPRRAVLGDSGNLFVFVQNENAFERRAVVLGMRVGDQVEILEGILPGDKVVIRGNYQLQFASAPAKKPVEGSTGEHATTGTPTGASPLTALLSQQTFHVPAWAWMGIGFVLGGFVFGFLLRRTA